MNKTLQHYYREHSAPIAEQEFTFCTSEVSHFGSARKYASKIGERYYPDSSLMIMKDGREFAISEKERDEIQDIIHAHRDRQLECHLPISKLKRKIQDLCDQYGEILNDNDISDEESSKIRKDILKQIEQAEDDLQKWIEENTDE